MGVLGCRGRSPLRQSSTKLPLSAERGERGGEAAAPAGRKLPQEARAARSRGRAKTRFEPSVSRIWQKQNTLVYVCDIYFPLYFFNLVCNRALTHGGLGCRGRSPLRQSSTKLPLSAERGERGGEAAAPAGRKLPQEARAARSRGGRKSIRAEC